MEDIDVHPSHMPASELMQMQANERNGGVRVRAGLLLAGSAAGLLVSVLWQPTITSSTSNVIGGTSAGLAVMGEWTYTARGDKPDDKESR